MPEMLRLYLDQMLRMEVAETLRHEGYDVVRTSEVGQSRADDWQILQKAIAENRILITLDKHFGDWVVLPLYQWCREPQLRRYSLDVGVLCATDSLSQKSILIIYQFYLINLLLTYKHIRFRI